jgi:hypothetical protein
MAATTSESQPPAILTIASCRGCHAGATLMVIGNLVTGQHSFNGDRVDLIEKDWFDQAKYVLEAMLTLKEELGIGAG